MNTSILKILLIGLMAPAAWAASGTPVVEVYKRPTCGCCNQWVKHLKANGFQVIAHDTNNVVAHKQRLGVPLGMGSCHTAKVGGYVIEGHVPASDVKRLLAEKPQAVGLAVPSMPPGSPGMESARPVPYQTLLVRTDGATQVFVQH